LQDKSYIALEKSSNTELVLMKKINLKKDENGKDLDD
jgi:hypothetical protein